MLLGDTDRQTETQKDVSVDVDVCPRFREAEVSSCQDQLGEFKLSAGALWKWIEESRGKVPLAQASCSEDSLARDLQTVTVSQNPPLAWGGGVMAVPLHDPSLVLSQVTV